MGFSFLVVAVILVTVILVLINLLELVVTTKVADLGAFRSLLVNLLLLRNVLLLLLLSVHFVKLKKLINLERLNCGWTVEVRVMNKLIRMNNKQFFTQILISL